MEDIGLCIDRHGGLAATFELRRDGHDRGAVDVALKRRALIRVRQGWYARPTVHPVLLQAARVGGRATCTTGLRLHGSWAPDTGILHVQVDAHASRLRSRRDSRHRLDRDVRVHWRTVLRAERLLLPPLECLRDAVDCCESDLTFALAESLLHAVPALRGSWAAFVHTLPITAARTLRDCDGVCESGTEALFWLRMRGLVRLYRQVAVPGIGRVDFLIGVRLIVEIDGREYHVDPERFEADRRRDAAASRLGYRVLRFSYRQVMERWNEVEAAVLAAWVRGDHE
ncbi:MAG TPA: DUF559 domain-containing protein [Rhodoglobus sp.]|nr:DUF559 domain-containing protein [Rhodoglobus sp.]